MKSFWTLQSDDGAYQFCGFRISFSSCTLWLRIVFLSSSYYLRTPTTMCRISCVCWRSCLLYAVVAVWSKPEFASQFGGRSDVQREPSWVQPPGPWDCGAKLDRRVTSGWHQSTVRFGLPTWRAKLLFNSLGNFEDYAWSLDRAELRYCKRELVASTTYHGITGSCLGELSKGYCWAFLGVGISHPWCGFNNNGSSRLKLWAGVGVELFSRRCVCDVESSVSA